MIDLAINRDSVCMADDAFDNSLTLQIQPIYETAKFVETVLNHFNVPNLKTVIGVYC